MFKDNLCGPRKYRPQHIKDLVNQEAAKERLLEVIEHPESMTSHLYLGRPGTGKTTVSHCLANDLFGEQKEYNFAELNASDERGIGVVRGFIKQFARISTVGDYPFRILLLDEMDNMLSDGQWALRRTMEKASASCRFIFTANYPRKIIEPLRSRCTPFRFTLLEKEKAVPRLNYITDTEGVKVEEGVFDIVYEKSHGDLRQMINSLQSSVVSNAITVARVNEIVESLWKKDINKMLQLSMGGDFSGARKSMYKLMHTDLLSGEEIVKEVFYRIIEDEEFPNKFAVLQKVSDVSSTLATGADEDIALSSFISWICADEETKRCYGQTQIDQQT